jgi:hypothetical protein
MRQALHIFRKDARGLRWELLLVLVSLAWFVYGQTRPPEESENSSRNGAEAILLGCVSAFVCARLIQAETIPGDRQFWITRPYSWRSLMGAKLLFVAVFLAIPLLVANAAILRIEGFSVEENAPGLICSALLVTLGGLLALCALATLVRGIGQWMLVSLLAVAGYLGLVEISKGNALGGVEWMRDLGVAGLLFLLASAVLMWQYTRRGTAVARFAMAVGLLAIWLCRDNASLLAALQIQTGISQPKVDLSAIQVAPREDSAKKASGSPPASADQMRRKSLDVEDSWSSEEGRMKFLSIPVDLSGLEKGTDVIGDGGWASLELQGESAGGVAFERLERQGGGFLLVLHVDDATLEKALLHRVNLHLTLYLTLVGNPVTQVIEPGARPSPVPGVGLCSVYDEESFRTLRCISPLRQPANLMVVRFGRERRDWFLTEDSYSPLPAELSISPLHWYWRSVARDSDFFKDPVGTQIPGAIVTSLKPLAHFRRDLVLAMIDLSDYRMSRF